MGRKIIYASYGSNMFTDRFMAYIQGGTPNGASRTYEGCRDKTAPTKKFVLQSSGLEMYFSRNSTVWGEQPYNIEGSNIFGGLSLMSPKFGSEFIGVQEVDPRATTLEMITAQGSSLFAGYVIDVDQFEDVVAQENRLEVGSLNIPDEIFDQLTAENPKICLRGRVGENAILLSSGEVFEVDITVSYDSLMFLGDIEVDGEKVKVVTFTNSRTYEMAAAQSYVNMALSNVPISQLDEAREVGHQKIEEILGVRPDDSVHRLNPAAANYVEMIANGIVEIGGGAKGWSKENALSYVLSKPPFSVGQLPELATQVTDFLRR